MDADEQTSGYRREIELLTEQLKQAQLDKKHAVEELEEVEKNGTTDADARLASALDHVREVDRRYAQVIGERDEYSHANGRLQTQLRSEMASKSDLESKLQQVVEELKIA